jgi:hypothetical protein
MYRAAPILMLVALSLFMVAGCATTSSIASTDLCKFFRQTMGEVADGETAPLPIQLQAGQQVNIQYVAEFTQGSATFVLLNEAGTPIWSQPITTSAANGGSATTPVPITVDAELSEGAYNVVIAFTDMNKHQICWRVDVN